MDIEVRTSPQKRHEIYFDNYFNSVLLIETLYEKGIMACGTVGSDRKHLPGFLVDRALTRGSMDMPVSLDQRVTAYKWMDNKAVYLLSNLEQKREVCSTPRKMAHG